MILPNTPNLKYGVIYIFYDPDVKETSRSVGAADFIQKIAHPFKIEWVPEMGRGQDNTLLVARRFNLGNLGHYATVSLRTSDNNPRGLQFDALHKFRDLLFEVMDGNEGNIELDENDFWLRFESAAVEDSSSPLTAEPPLPSAAPQDHTRVEQKRRSIRSFWKKKEKYEASDTEEVLQSMIRNELHVPDARLEDEERRELAAIERERTRALELIRTQIINYIAQYNEDPQELIKQLLIGKVIVGTQCRVLVNGDMKVVLPEYDEMEIKMPAMSRTLYILFMKLRKQGRDGIVLRNIDEFRDDIIDIYSLVKPGANDERVAQSVDNLCDPISESLHQAISRINRCIKSVITDKKLVEQYMITGTRGGEYGIALDPELIELPRAVTN